MKIKTSMKVCENFENVYCCSCASLYHIMFNENAKYYNAGVYGWNCDIYIDYPTDTLITTGYRNMRGKTIQREIIKKYDAIAKEILDKYDFTQLEQNKNEFMQEILKG